MSAQNWTTRSGILKRLFDPFYDLESNAHLNATATVVAPSSLKALRESTAALTTRTSGEQLTGIRVLLAATEWPPMVGGGGSHSYYLAEALHRSGVDVFVVSAIQREPVLPYGFNPKRFLMVDPSEFAVGGSISSEAWRQLSTFVRNAGSVSAIHAQHYPGYTLGCHVRALLGCLHGCKPRFFATIHKTPPRKKVNFAHDSGLASVYAIATSVPPDFLIANSNSFHSLLLDTGTNPERIKQINHGIPVERFEAGANQPRPVNYKYIICPARIDLRKNLEDAVLAWRRASAQQGTHLLITGTPSPRDAKVVADVNRLKGRAKPFEKQLHFGDPRRARRGQMIPFQDMPRFLAHAIACVFPSVSEGFGLAGLEAMAAGTPLIAGDNPGVREFVNNGKDAFLLPESVPKRRKRLADLLAELHAPDGSKRLKIVMEGHKTARAFSSQVMAERHIALYQS